MHFTAITMETLIARFLHTPRFYLIYPIILASGLTLRFISPHGLYTWLQHSYWVSSKNFINQIFAHNGNTVFLILFIAVLVLRLVDAPSNHQSRVSLTKQYTVKLGIKQFGLWALFYIIDHIFLATGGSCAVTKDFTSVLAQGITSFEECFKVNGTWVRLNEGFCSLTPDQFSGKITAAQVCYKFGKWEGGFDISGHYCFLVTLSLILWNELKGLQAGHEAQDLEAQTKSVPEKAWTKISTLNVLRWVLLLTILIWMNMLFVTAMFYHSVSEKLFGLVFGFVTPSFMYLLIPYFPIMEKYAYL